MTSYTYDLYNDEQVVISIKGRDQSGKFEPLDGDDDFSVSNSDEAALSASIGVDHVGAPALVLCRKVHQAQNVMVELRNKAGRTPVKLHVNILPNPASRKGLDLDVANAASSPVPAIEAPDDAPGEVLTPTRGRGLRSSSASA